MEERKIMWLWSKRISPGLFLAGFVAAGAALLTSQPSWAAEVGFAMMLPEIVGQLTGKW